MQTFPNWLWKVNVLWFEGLKHLQWDPCLERKGFKNLNMLIVACINKFHHQHSMKCSFPIQK